MKLNVVIIIVIMLLYAFIAKAQRSPAVTQWIRPENGKSAPIWGIHNGIVVGLWPASIDGALPGSGGPRGLLRIGYEFNGALYLINYIAVEPVVNGDMEFSEVSPSQVDGKLGKYFWASDSINSGGFTPYASTRGILTHPDAMHPEIEQLTLYILMEKFIDGAHPYLKLTISSNNPGELGIQIFNHEKSVHMDRCALTATMGNYSRLRLLYLKDTIIDSRKLYAGYNDIEFAEKRPYSNQEMLRNKNGDPIIIAESDESFNELASWPQTTNLPGQVALEVPSLL